MAETPNTNQPAGTPLPPTGDPVQPGKPIVPPAPAQPTTEPAAAPAQPAMDPTAEPAAEPAQAVAQPVAEPTAEPTAEPVSAQSAESVQPAVEPMQPAQPVAQPTPQPSAPPASYTSTAAVPPAAPASYAQPAPAQQPVAQPTQQPVAQPTQPAPQPVQPASQPAQPAQPTPQPAQPVQPGDYAVPAAPPAGSVPPPPPGAAADTLQSGNSGTGAMVCGILAIVLALFLPLVAIILGIVAIVLSGRAAKVNGRNGRASGGKACGIIGIVLSIILIVATLAIGFSVISWDDDLSSSSGSSLSSDESYSSLSAEEKECADVVIAQLDRFGNKDSEVVASLAESIESDFSDTYDVTLSEVGVDSNDIVDWLLTDFSYSIDDVFIYSDDETATVYVDTNARDYYELSDAILDDISDYMNTSEFDAASAEEVAAKVEQIIEDAMASTDDMYEGYLSFSMTKTNGTWEIDEGEWDYVYGSIFELY